MITGPLASGRYSFQTAQAVISAQTPTTAIVIFPRFTQHADRMAFMADNKLHFLRWLRSDDPAYGIALVKLPSANLQPMLLDPVEGRFQITLPQELTVESVSVWAAQNELQLISYAPDTGIAIVRPKSWQPPASVAPISYTYPRSTMPAPPQTMPAGPLLYVQFAPDMTATAVNDAARGLSMGLVSISAGNLAILSVDPARVKAEVQLLSDMATVQCVSTAPNPCAQIVAGTSAAASTPSLQQFGQPSALTAQVINGVLRLDWTAASGATGYAIFAGTSRSGPFQLSAVIAGQQHTSFDVFQVSAPGSTVYYQVLALHACASGGDSSTCDAFPIATSGQGPVMSWTNPIPIAAQPAPSPSPATSNPGAASPAPATSPAPSPSPAPPPAAPAPPTQTQSGAAPLAAPAALTTNPADGHVLITWASVPGANGYRLYRSLAGGAVLYIAQTSQLSFTDVAGATGASYTYEVAAVSPNGLLGALSAGATATWVAATTSPSVARSLPAESGALAGRIRFEVDAQSGSGLGSVQWRITGPAAAMTIGTAPGQPSASSALSWSATLAWDTATVPDGSYSVTATVVDAGGPQMSVTSQYRIQNGAPPAPVSLDAVAQAGGVALSWQQADSAAASSYRLFRDAPIAGTPLTLLSADSRSDVDSTAAPGQHVYQLVLVDAAGHQSPAAVVTVTVTSAAAPPGPSANDLRLMLPSGDVLAAGGRVTDRLILVAPAADGLKFQLSPNGNGWSDIGQLPLCGETCTLDLDLRPMPVGPYLVRAATPSSVGTPHSFVHAEAVRYAAPGSLNASTGPLGALLTWTAPTRALPAYYAIERRIDAGDWQLLDRVAATGYVDSQAPAGTDVSYRVTAVDLEGTPGQTSNEATVSLPSAKWAVHETMSKPIAPTGLEVSSSHGRATLRWQHVEGSDGYAVERQSQAGGPFALAGMTAAESFSDTHALSAGNYAYRVIALNGPVGGTASTETSTFVVPSLPPAPIPAASSGPANAPPAPTAVKTSSDNGGVSLSWSAAPGTSSSTTYNVYRLNPATAAFTAAATGLRSPTYVDTGLSPQQGYGYVVTASAPNGLESSYSSPAWVNTPAAQSLNLALVAPVPAQAYIVQPDNASVLARVNAAAGLAGVSFEISGGDGIWKSLPAAPVDPGQPTSPSPSLATGFGTLWSTNLTTASLAPGQFQLRVRARDRAGNEQQQVESLFVSAAGARGPPAFALTTTPTSGGVHLAWSPSVGTYTVQRSLFGTDGPFESIATTQSPEFDDRTAIPGLNYVYRVVAPQVSAMAGPVQTASAGAPNTDGGPVLRLGDVSSAELSVRASTVTQPPALDGALHGLSAVFDIAATSLATGSQVHLLGEPAQLTFQLPPSASTVDAAAMGIYHWDDGTGTWIKESATTNPDASSISVTIDHLSLFVLASTNANLQSANPGPPSTALNQPASTSTGSAPAQPQSWADLPFNPDGEIPSLRTASATVYRTAGGGFRRVISAGLVNFKDANGAWQKIDTTLVPSGVGGDIRNAAGPLSFDLPATAGAIGVTAAQGSLTMTIRGAGGSAVKTSGTSVTYAALLPGIDATYQVVPGGLTESLIIGHRPASPITITYDLSTAGLTLSLGTDGSVTATDARGSVAFVMPAPSMMETPGGQQRPGAPSSRIVVTLTGGAGSYVLTYTPDMAWLQDPGRRYPVTIDPSFTVYNENDSLGDQYGNVWCCGGWSPNYDYPVGLDYGNGHKYRVLIQLDGSYGYQDILCSNCYATSAYLSVDEATDNGYSHPTIYAYETTQRYALGSNLFNVGTQGSPATASAPTGSGWFSFNVTSIVQSWQTTAQGAAGDFLMTGNECCYDDIFIYDANSGSAPNLTIYYAGDTISSPAPDPITAQPGSIVNIPLKLTNPNGDFTWGSSNLNDIVRVGVLSSTKVNNVSSGVSQPLSFLPSDVGPGGTINMNALIQAPLDPGDYWYTLDLRRDTSFYPNSSIPAPIWFSTICGSTCNQTFTVHVRVVAPGDQQAASVPVTVGDGSTASVNSSNGSSTLSATDLSINELGDTALSVSRTYNSVNGSLGSNSTNNSSPTYGVGWTYSFQKTVALGSWQSAGGMYETLRNGTGLYTDSSGKTWPLVWNPGRGLWEDAAGGRTVTGPMPVDLLERSGTSPLGTDNTQNSALLKHFLVLDGGTPQALIVQAGRVPTLPGGSIEAWFRPDFNMAGDGAAHTLVEDSKGYFIINWNANGTSHAWCFSVYNKDINTWSSACSSAVNWTQGTWHQIVATWSVPGTMVKTLYLDGAQVSQYEDAGLSQMGDLYFGYQPKGGNAVLNGAITGLRIDSSALSAAQVSADYSSVSEAPLPTTLYLGTFVNSPDSAGTGATYNAGSTFGYDILTNSNQTQEIYDPGTGHLVAERDRLGNQIDYSWDSQNRISSLTDHSLAGRSLTFCHSSTCGLPSPASFRVTDPGGRTVDYTVNSLGDLVGVTKSNAVPDPLTGVVSQQPFSTTYGYAGGHLLQTIQDPRGSRTNFNFDASYRQAVMADLPTNYWRLGDNSTSSTSGGAADSANPCPKLVLTSCNGTYSGGVTLGQRGPAFGDPNTSAAFDGTSGSLAVTGTALAAGAPYTVEAWVKPNTTLTGTRTIAGFTQGANYGELWLNSLVPTFRIGTASSAVDIGAASALSGAWHHIVGTYDGTSGRLYVDGQVAAGPIAVASAAGSSAISIGSVAGVNFFPGNIAEVALYPSALSASRAQAHFITGRLGVAASATGYAGGVVSNSPIGYWRLGEYAGNQAIDQSGYGNNGTYSGGYSLNSGGPLTTDPAMSAVFDGNLATAAINLPNVDTTTGHQVTVEFWMYWTGGTATSMPFGFNTYDLFINYPNAGNFGFNTGCSDVYGMSNTIPANTWLHVAAIFTNGGVTSNQLYIDGVSQTLSQLNANASCARSVSTTANISGWPNSTSYRFNGAIEEVAVYNGALSVARIQTDYAAGKAAPSGGASPYPASVLSDSPAGYWRLGDTGGTSAADASGNGLTGTYTPVGGYFLSQPGAVPTDPGLSARFNGTSGYVSIGNPTVLQMGNGTIEAWVNTTTASQSSIAAKLHAWWFGIQTTGKLGFYDMTAGVMRDAGVVVNDGRWHLVAVTFKNATANGSQMYVDGVAAGSVFQMTIAGQANVVEFAGYETTAQFLNGRVQDVAIFPTVLSANRMLAHYQASRINLSPLPPPGGYGANVKLDNPLGYWRLDEIGGTTATDRSGNGNNGTYSGGYTLGAAGALPNDSDGAVTLNGSTGYVSTPTESISSAITVEAWMYSTSLNQSGFIVGKNLVNGNWELFISAGTMYWRSGGTGGCSSTGFTDLTTTAPTANIWHYVAATQSGGSAQIYIDGLLVVSSSSMAAINNSGGTIDIGRFGPVSPCDPSGAYYFVGSLDEVAIYGTALPAARIAAHYAAASGARRVLNVQDPRGTTASTFNYNDDVAMTQVTDGLGEVSYYTFQHAGGRTVSYQDPLGNLTTYAWNGRSAFQLDGSLSPGGILDSSVSNSLAPVGQQAQALITDKSNQPPDQIINYAAASASPTNWWPQGSATYGVWNWDYQQQVITGVPTHSSPYVNGTYQQHQFQNVAAPILVPSGSTVTQWVYFQPGVPAPSEIMLQFYSQDASSWEHRAYWGPDLMTFGTSRKQQSALLPLTGHWVALTVQLGPILTSAGKSTDVGMEGHTLGGIAYDVFTNQTRGGTTWWGPTILDFPPATAPANLQHQTSTFAYDQTNNQVAKVDPNGIATVTDYDANGLARQVSSGLHAPTPPVLFEDPLMYNGILTNPWTFEQLSNGAAATTANGTATYTGYGSLTQTQNDNASESDLYRDVTGLRPGSYARVSVWASIQLSSPTYGTNNAGGAMLWVDDGLLPNTNAGDSPVQRQTPIVQPAANTWVQLSVPFLVDQTGRLRIHLVQIDAKGNTGWADVRVEDITPVPDVTLQATRTVYMADFEQSTDRSAWILTSPSGGVTELLGDGTRSHGGAYSVHISSPNTSASGSATRAVTLTPGFSYHVSAWVKTVASGSYSETYGAGAQLQLTTPANNGTALSYPVSPAQLRTYGKWQLLAFDTPQIWYGAMTLTLSLGSFAGDVYFDDVKIEQSGTAASPFNLVQSASATGTTPVTVTLPAGTKAGDLLVATVQEQGVAGGQPSAPAGWTKIEDSEFSGGTSIWYSKNVAGGLTSFPFSTATSSKLFVAVSEWSGADPGAPLDVHAHGSQSGPSLQATASAAGAIAGDLAITAFTEQNTWGNYFTVGGGWTSLASNNNFGSGNVTSGVTDQQIAAANGTLSETETSSAAAAGSNWDWVIATFKRQAPAPANTYWFSFTDTSYFSAVDVHVFNPGSEPALGAIVIPGQTPLNVNVAAGVNWYYSLKNNYSSRQLGPIKVVTSVPVIASMRTNTSGGGFDEMQAQQAAAAAATLYFSWYDSTGSVTYDYINVFNPGSAPVTGSIAGLAINPNPTFSLAPGGIQLLKFASVSAGPITITATGPILASQRVIYGNAYSEVAAQSTAAAAATVYFSNIGSYPTANFYVINPSYPATGSWSLTVTVPGGSTQSFSNVTANEQTFNYNGVSGGPVKIAASVPVLASIRILYGSPAIGFLELNGSSAPVATQYFNWFDLASSWITSDSIAVANPGSTAASGTISMGSNTPLSINVAAGQMAYYNFPAGQLGGPVTVAASVPVVISQRTQTTSHYWGEVYAQTVPSSGAPGAPANVVAIPGNGQATVEWSAPTSSGSSSITSYQVASSAGVTQTVTGASAVYIGLTNNNSYTFSVAAVNGSGQGPWSQPSSVVIPGTTNVALPVSSGWQLVTSSSGSATATQQPAGGIGGGPSRVIAVTTTSTISDVKDVLPVATLRNGATYVISAWVSATTPGTIDFSLRDGSGNVLAMDQATSCSITTTLSLCEGSLTYTAPDYQLAQLTLQYGGQGARTITVSHPLVALSAERHDYSAAGQPTVNYDVFGHLSRTDYDSQGLYPIDTVERMSVDYHQTVLADGPLAYWPLDDGGGSTGVDLAGTHPLTVTGSLSGSGVLPALPSTHSLTNDGTLVSVANSSSLLGALNDSNGQSIEMWVSLNGIPAYNDSVFALTGTGTGHLDRWNGDGTPYPAYFEPARHHFNVQIPTSGVHHIVYTRRTGGRYRLYLDGVLVGDDPAGTFGVPSTLFLGGNGSNLSFKGNLADVAIYSSELTATQVVTHYQVGMGQLDLQPPSYGTRERASYSASVAADAPAAYWRLGDAGGSAVMDSSGHGLNGTYNGGVTIGPGAPAGDANTSAVFDGTSGYVSVPGAGLSATATLEAWVKGSGTWSTGTEGVLSSGNDSLSVVNGHPYASFYIGGTARNLDSGVSISTGAWHHLAASWDGYTIRIYIDGSLAAFSSPGAGSLNEVGGGAIGYYPFFNGALDEAAIYSRALAPGRIQAHYWAGVSQVTATTPTYSSAVLADNPAGYWQLSDSTGTGAADSSGNNNAGSITGGFTLNQPGPAADGTSSIALNGSTGVISVASASTLNPTTAITMEAWVYEPTTPTVFQGVIDKNHWDQYRLGVGANLLATVRVTNGVGADYVDNCPGQPTPPAIAAGQWHYLTYTFDGVAGVVTWYIDGAKVCSSTHTNSGFALTAYNTLVSTTVPLLIGEDSGASGYFSGRIGEVAVYPTAVSAARVLAHYQAAQVQLPSRTPYTATVLADRPQGYWRLGEGAGTAVADSTGNGNVGTVSGGVTLVRSGATPDGDTSAALDGVSGVVTVPNSAELSFGKAVTMEAWVYQSAVPSVFGDVIDKGSWNEYRMGVGTTPLATIQVTNGSSYNFAGNCPGTGQPAMPSLSLNQWHQLAYTFDGVAGVVSWYIDGSLFCSSTQTDNGNQLTAYNTLAPNAFPLVIGQDTGMGGYYTGRVDEVAVYSTALPAGRILAHYQASILGGRQLVTGIQHNAVGQRVATVKYNGPVSVVDQFQLDSWGRLAREVQNSTSGAASVQANVVTGLRYDLNGNMVDTYEQSATGGTVDAHSILDANNNQVAEIQNCMGGATCGGTTGPDQNIVTTFAYDALNRRTDSSSALPSCTGTPVNCVPLPACSVTAPIICTPPTTPCPTATCVDDHTVYDPGGRTYQEISNYGGGQADLSQVNLTTTYTYDADGKVLQTSTPISGYNLNISPNLQSGFIVDQKNYDALGQEIADIRAASTPSWMQTTQPTETDYTLDAGGRTVSVTGPGTGTGASFLRVVTARDLDDVGRVQSVTKDWGTVTAGANMNLNATSKTVYDSRGSTHSFTSPTQQSAGGLETTTNYDLANHVVAAIKDDAPGGLRITATTVNDALGRVSDVIDPRGIDTNTTYDALDRAVTTTANYCPSGSVNPNCNGSGVTSDQNAVSTVVYDLGGNRIETIKPLGIVQYTAFDALGRELSVTENCTPVPTPPSTSCGALGPAHDQNVTRSQTYDQAGNVLTTTDPLLRKNVYAYDALGRKTSETVHCVNSSGQCDAGTGPANDQNLVTQLQVDAQGDVLQERSPRQWSDGQNLTTAYFYDALLRLVSVTEDQGSTAAHLNLPTTYTYDPSGNLLSQEDGRQLDSVNTTTNFSIDHLGRTWQVVDAGSDGRTSNTVQTNFDNAGEATSTFDSRNKVNTNAACGGQQATVCYTLDRVGRVVSVSYLKADGSTQLIQSFTYDADSNRTSFADTDVAQTTISYDHLNRVSVVTSPPPIGKTTALTTTYTYNLDGAVTAISDPTGSTTYTVDNLDRLATMVDPVTGGTTRYTIDEGGRLIGRIEANGIVTTPTYNGVDQLASKTEVLGANTLAQWTGILYDTAQNRTSETLYYPNNTAYPDPQSSQTVPSTYQYDQVDQLVQASIPGTSAFSYAYDKAHNLKTNGAVQQTYFNNEALNLVGTQAAGSDAVGNELNDASGRALTWNVLNQLESFAGSLGTETYTYDAMGRLTTIKTGATLTRQFVYRGVTDQLIEELDGSGNASRSDVWDTAGRQLYTNAAGGTAYYEITNPHGDVAALASALGLAGTEHFDPWGNVVSSSGALAGFPMGFQGSQGSWTEASSGFVYMAARWYYPTVARFLSSDPAAGTADPRTPMGRDRWLYGVNDPLIHSDPTGLNCEDRVCGKNHTIEPEQPVSICDAACEARVQTDAAARKKAQHKQQTNCAWYDAVCKAKQALEAAKKVASDAWNYCKNSDVCKTVAPIAVSLAVGLACGVAIGWTGVGAVACAGLAGAVSGALSGALECKSGESIGGCMATGAAIGAVTGLAGYGVGKLLSIAGRAAVGALGRTGLGRAIASGASRALGAVRSGASRAMNAVRSAASDAIGAVRSGVSRVASALRNSRLPQDVNVSPEAPPALSLSRSIGGKNADAAVQADIRTLRAQGATDFRLNQQQVDVNGVRVGTNRPDLQYTYRGGRYYSEYDTPSSGRGPAHAQRILANDPRGRVNLFIV